MKVRDIMTRSVAFLKPDDPVKRAAQLMKEHDIGAVPVRDNNKIVGIVTDRDITIRIIAEGRNPNDMMVRDVMTGNLVTGTPDMDVQEAGRMMSEHQIRRLPIMENNELVGIISLGDIALEPHLEDHAGEVLSEVSEPGGQKGQMGKMGQGGMGQSGHMSQGGMGQTGHMGHGDMGRGGMGQTEKQEDEDLAGMGGRRNR